jgi:hypothetical protein
MHPAQPRRLHAQTLAAAPPPATVSQTLARRRHCSTPTPSPNRRGHPREVREEVRRKTVSFICVLVHRVAGLASPGLRRPPSCAVLAALGGRRGVRRVPLNVLVQSRDEWCTPTPIPPCAAARRRAAAGHAPPPAARAGPGPSDPRSTVQIRWTPPGQTGMHRSTRDPRPC